MRSLRNSLLERKKGGEKNDREKNPQPSDPGSSTGSSVPSVAAGPDATLLEDHAAVYRIPARIEKYGLHFLNQRQFDEDVKSKNRLYSVDIVAVHGLNGDAHETWTVKESKKMWLHDFLPAELPGARIFSFGYPSEVGLTLATGKIEDFARSLLNGLSTRRSTAEVQIRLSAPHYTAQC